MAKAGGSAPPRDFAPVTARLRALIEAHADGLIVSASSSGEVKLERPPGGQPWDYVAGLRVGKNYVSYYFMPVYAMPALLEGISPELRRRMQGKACFNFTKVDEALFAELDSLTATGVARFRDREPPPRSR
jgi:hypothetical protein